MDEEKNSLKEAHGLRIYEYADFYGSCNCGNDYAKALFELLVI